MNDRNHFQGVLMVLDALVGVRGKIRGIFKKFPHFSRETVRAGVVVIGHVWECHVTSQSGKLADLAVEYEICTAVVKMAAKLINCTKEEQHSVICFLWAEGVPGAQIHLRMCAQYGDKVLSRRIVY